MRIEKQGVVNAAHSREPKDVETAARDLAEAVKRHNFGVLHVYDLKVKLKEKGVDFPHEFRIFVKDYLREEGR